MSDAHEKKVTILNRGPRTYHLLGGAILAPQSSMEVGEEEAKSLLQYRDLVDASTIVKSPSSAALRKENEELRRQLAEARADTPPQGEPQIPEKEPPAHPHGGEHHGGKRTTRAK